MSISSSDRSDDTEYHRGFANRLKDIASAFPDQLPALLATIPSALDDLTLARVIDTTLAARDPGPTALAVNAALLAQRFSRQGTLDEAEATLHKALNLVAGSPIAEMVAADELAQFLLSKRDDRKVAELLFQRVADLAERLPPGLLRIKALRRRALCLDWTGPREEAVVAAQAARAVAADYGTVLHRALTARDETVFLAKLGQLEEAIAAARAAEAFAREANDVRVQASAVRSAAWSHLRLKRYLDAIELADHAAAPAAEAGHRRGEVGAAQCKAMALRRLDRYEEALAVARDAARRAAEIGDPALHSATLCEEAEALAKLGQHEAAIGVARQAVRFGMASGRAGQQARALTELALSLNALTRYAEAWDHAAEAFPLAVEDAEDAVISSFCAASEAARHLPRPACLAMYERWIKDYRARGLAADPRLWFDEVVASVIRADAWAAFATFLAREESWLRGAQNTQSLVLTGRTLVEIGRELGSDAAANTLGRIVQVMAGLFGNQESSNIKDSWLYALILGMVLECREPALLRSLAGALAKLPLRLGKQMAHYVKAAAQFDGLSEKGQRVFLRILKYLRRDIVAWMQLVRKLPASS